MYNVMAMPVASSLAYRLAGLLIAVAPRRAVRRPRRAAADNL